MHLKHSIIESLREIVGETNVLTDAEDLHVYSFEQFFNEGKRYPKLDAVARVTSDAEAQEIMELAQKEGIAAFGRRTENTKALQAEATPTILIDDAAQPQLEALTEIKEKDLRKELEEEVHKAGHGSFRNFALALKSCFSSLPAQKCLNCNVCSGYCTVSSSFDGVETWSSKGRTLLTRGLSSGDLQPSPKLVDVLYTCSLCGLCFADCFENTQVRKAIMEGRRRLVENGHTPELFAATAKNILEVGEPGGTSPSKRVAWTERLQQKRVFPRNADLLYWSGCVVSTRTPNVAVSLGNVLNRAGVDFTFLGEKEGCCGYVLFAAGLWNQARENAARLVERVKATRAETLITTCAGCYYTFTRMYPEILNVELPCQVLHATQYTEHLIKERKITTNSLDWRVTYHDPCSLGRHSNVYQSPRNILKSVPNLDFVEMPLVKNRSRCCGAGGGLWSYNNTVATKCAEERLVKDAKPLGVSALATACPTCHINLRNASVRKSLGIKVYDLIEIVGSATAPTQE